MQTYPGVFDPESIVQWYLYTMFAYDERPLRSYYLYEYISFLHFLMY